MLEIRKILVPIDFSERSTAAAKHAVALAHRFDSELTFVHVIPPAPPELAAFEGGYYTARLKPTREETVAYSLRQMECIAPMPMR